jgi:hypothetical protein
MSDENSDLPERLSRRTRTILFTALFAILCGLVFDFVALEIKGHSASNVDVSSYTTYTNSRCSYSFSYDPTLFKQVSSHSQGTVETFTSKDGRAFISVVTSQLTTWALPQIFDLDVIAYQKADPSMVVTGRSMDPVSFTITASGHHTYGFEKAVLHDGIVTRLRVTYNDDNSSYPPAVQRTLESFHNTSTSPN